MRPAGKAAAAIAALLAAVGAGLFVTRGRHARRTEASTAVRFTDVTRAAGIDFKHHNGARGKKYMPETVGSGVAWFDYDGDNRLDLFFVNSTDWPGRHKGGPHLPALYRNNGDGTFTDVTRAAGLAIDVYGMGAAPSDYDNDGDTDLFLTCIGPNRLFRNEGDGHFTDVTHTAGLEGRPVEPGGVRWKWSSSAAWCDFDQDGIQDLFVCNYVKWTPETDVFCATRNGSKKAYCAPHNFEGVPSLLYRGRGDGTFEDVSDQTGISSHVGKSFGVVPVDLNGDGWTDFAVTNDTSPNFIFISDHGKRFREAASEMGFAVSETGRPKAGMGIDAGVFDDSGRIGLLTGNFSRECLSLYTNDGRGGLTESGYPLGVAEPSLLSLTFPVFFFDFDLDGRQDIFAGNGHIDDFVTESDAQITYEQRSLLYRNLGRRFREVGMESGPAPASRLVARGAAWGDFDLDGDPDIALVWNNHAGLLWRNEGRRRQGWIGLKLHGTRSNRDGLGAIVRVAGGGRRQTFQVFSGGSFLSQRQRWLLAGLNGAQEAESVEIDWPSGERTRLSNIEAGRYYEVVEGESRATPVATR